MADIVFSLTAIRKKLPLPVRMSYGWLKRKFVPHPVLGNEEFQRYYRWLREAQWWSRSQLEGYQLEQLQVLVRHAYENVPYYRRAFDERRLKPKDIATLSDLQKIPLLSKDDVRHNPEDFIARNIDRNRLRFWTTGGSSGTPLGMYQDRYTVDLYESAFRWRQWTWAGCSFWDRKARLHRGEMRRLTGTGKRVCWDYSTRENELVLSARDMSEENMHKFVQKIREFKPRFLIGIPSAVEILARFMQRNEINDIEVTAIFCEAERLYSWQRELIESQFRSRIFAGYGMSERVADAVECDQHNGYHVSMEYGILELLDKNDEPITEPEVLGRVVGTGFHNYAMPLIRYEMNDLAMYARGECSCGRQLTLVRDFRGRLREFFVSKSGKLVPVQLIWTGRHPVWARIRELSFFQEGEGDLAVRVVTAPQFSEAEVASELLEEIHKVLDEKEFRVQLDFVDHLRLTKRLGKLGFLEQRLPIEFGDLDPMDVEMAEIATGCQSAAPESRQLRHTRN